MSKTKSEMEQVFIMWRKMADEAKKSGDYKMYEFFLRTMKKELSKVYLELTNKEWIELVGNILKTTTCEINKIVIKYKKSKVPF